MLGGSRLTLSKYITGVLIKGLSRAIQGLNIFKGERKGSKRISVRESLVVAEGERIDEGERVGEVIYSNKNQWQKFQDQCDLICTLIDHVTNDHKICKFRKRICTKCANFLFHWVDWANPICFQFLKALLMLILGPGIHEPKSIGP